MMGSIGGVSGTSALQQMQAMRTQVFNRSDADGSGGLSVDEFQSLVEAAPGGKGPPGVDDVEGFFKTADADGNGELTQAELDSAFEAQMQNFQSTVSRFGDGPPPPPPGGPPPGEEDDSDSSTCVQKLSTGDLLKELLSRLQALADDGSSAGAGLSVQA